MLRTFLLVALLGIGAAGCVHRTAEPAWPKPSEPEVDGGESLEPHQAIAINEADDDVDTPSADSTDDATTTDDSSTADSDSDGDAAASSDDDASSPSDDDPIDLDDIVIEFGDD
jgi:hypothetical protein